jgi:hypothetical protein
MSIFIKIDILKPSLIQHFKKKMSTFINIEQKSGDYAILVMDLTQLSMRTAMRSMIQKSIRHEYPLLPDASVLIHTTGKKLNEMESYKIKNAVNSTKNSNLRRIR